MVRSYEVDFYVLDNRAGFMLYCFENDECVEEYEDIDQLFGNINGSTLKK